MNHIFREAGNLKCSKNACPDLIVVGIPTMFRVVRERCQTRFSGH
jgi:hypothetical protein